MLTYNNVEVWGFNGALRGARNPMNSWKKSDTEWRVPCSALGPDEKPHWCTMCGYDQCLVDGEAALVIGPNDYDLCKRLITAGSDHRKFLRMIHVQFDINAPLSWWKELDTYKVATVANSCSTMHKIHSKEFVLEDFSYQKLKPRALESLKDTISELNYWRDKYNDTKDKSDWEQMIELLPSSYNQLRTLDFNYETLTNIYKARRTHKMTEWHEFCRMIEGLPYSEFITGNWPESYDPEDMSSRGDWLFM